MGRADDSVLAGFDPEWGKKTMTTENKVLGTCELHGRVDCVACKMVADYVHKLQPLSSGEPTECAGCRKSFNNSGVVRFYPSTESDAVDHTYPARVKCEQCGHEVRCGTTRPEAVAAWNQEQAEQAATPEPAKPPAAGEVSWRFLRQSAIDNDSVTIHGATLHHLFKEYDDALTKLSESQKREEELQRQVTYFCNKAHENEMNGLRMRDEGNAKIAALTQELEGRVK